MDPDGVMVDGTGGIDKDTRSTLAAVPRAVQDTRRLIQTSRFGWWRWPTWYWGRHGCSRKTRAQPSRRAS
ncbi:MAG TPA: hypothetical protein VIS09_01960 [Streptomyces sp.]